MWASAHALRAAVSIATVRVQGGTHNLEATFSKGRARETKGEGWPPRLFYWAPSSTGRQAGNPADANATGRILRSTPNRPFLWKTIRNSVENCQSMGKNNVSLQQIDGAGMSIVDQ
jgi:hypothetical protein